MNFKIFLFLLIFTTCFSQECISVRPENPMETLFLKAVGYLDWELKTGKMGFNNGSGSVCFTDQGSTHAFFNGRQNHYGIRFLISDYNKTYNYFIRTSSTLSEANFKTCMANFWILGHEFAHLITFEVIYGEVGYNFYHGVYWHSEREKAEKLVPLNMVLDDTFTQEIFADCMGGIMLGTSLSSYNSLTNYDIISAVLTRASSVASKNTYERDHGNRAERHSATMAGLRFGKDISRQGLTMTDVAEFVPGLSSPVLVFHKAIRFSADIAYQAYLRK